MKKKYLYTLLASLSTAIFLSACTQNANNRIADSQPMADQQDRDVIAQGHATEISPVHPATITPSPATLMGRSDAKVSSGAAYADQYMIAQMPDTAQYKNYTDNPVKQVALEPLTTFSLDVDTGSYANVRRFITHGSMPPPDAVRVEEFINYFPPASKEPLTALGKSPFAINYELTPSPWDANKTLMRVNIEAIDVNMQELPPANLVFLVDVSGSMYGPDRLDLLKSSLKLLVDEMRPQDKVSLVTYASGTRVVLEPTSGKNKAQIRQAIDQLAAGGSTAGAAGLQLAYQMAEQGFIKNSVNRILLATDGDFNVGVTNTEELKAMVARAREKGITLSTLGFGSNNYNEALMVQIADVGNGNYSYIDTLSEAQKVLQEEMRATLVTVAKDVKAQIEFNPAQVLDYRQIGYEKRQLRNEDFNNDKVDAGDIGAGKRVTVLYELTLRGSNPSIDPLRYQQSRSEKRYNPGTEIAFLKMRWKDPHGDESQLTSIALTRDHLRSNFKQASTETRFLTAVAAFGQKLRNNPQLSQTSWIEISQWGEQAKGTDPYGYRSEFIKLVKLASSLNGK